MSHSSSRNSRNHNVKAVIRMKNLFSIGEVAEIKGVTIKALRYYHKMGILVPRHVDETTGYRYYSIDQFIHIDIIKCCRALGTRITELQEIFKECDTDELVEFLKLKRCEAEENINKMKEVIKNIDALNMSVEHSKKIMDDDEIAVEFFEQRHVIAAPCKEVGSLRELIYYSNLEKVAEDKRVELSMERGIMYDIDSGGNIKPSYVFNGIKGNGSMEGDHDIRMLSEGKYLTLTYRKENEQERLRKMAEYMKENNLKINSFVEVELLNDLFNTESYSCQIQIFIGSGK